MVKNPYDAHSTDQTSETQSKITTYTIRIIHGLPNRSIHKPHDMLCLQSGVVHPPSAGRRCTFANIFEDSFGVGLRRKGCAMRVVPRSFLEFLKSLTGASERKKHCVCGGDRAHLFIAQNLFPEAAALSESLEVRCEEKVDSDFVCLLESSKSFGRSFDVIGVLVGRFRGSVRPSGERGAREMSYLIRMMY